MVGAVNHRKAGEAGAEFLTPNWDHAWHCVSI